VNNDRRPVYLSIPRTLGGFGVVGMSSVPVVERKLALFNDLPPCRTAIIAFDAYRCSSTILACFGAGVVGAFVKEKLVIDSGVERDAAQRAAASLGRELIFGGEFDGKPIANAEIGNSPIDAFRYPLQGRLLHFQSTNFGRLLSSLTAFAERQSLQCDIFVMGFANVRAVARHISQGRYERILVAAAGFFECLALEDIVLGGAFIANLCLPGATFDDEALVMLSAYKSYFSDMSAMTKSWTARVLQELSKHDDIYDALNGQ
jgi:phosphosulfolactate phosphohydrolase-like enzyme